jgi:HAD superfamily hydrolase (TIGR01490 family)
MLFIILMETIISKETEKAGYLVFFDLDRTLTGAVSGNALAKRAWKNGLMSRSNLLHALILSAEYRLGIKDPVKAVYEMTGWVKGISEKEMETLCSEVFNDVILPSFYKEAGEEIKMHKGRNAKTVILSSSLTPICREAASYLGVDDIICSVLEISDGILTGRPVGKLCFGDEKLNRLKDYCEKNNTDPSDCWYYADALADLPVLQIVGAPVCVNPDKKLASIARGKGWKINYWS